MEQLKATKDRVIVKVDTDAKNSFTFQDGTKIRLERDYNNMDRKYTQISQGEVIHSEYIPEGAVILFHHNGSHDVNKVFNYKALSGEETASTVKYFSIPEAMCYLWKMPGGEWQPLKDFATGLRVFKPYTGVISGIPPTLIKNVLYLTSGEYKGIVCHTVRAADYQVIFQGDNVREESVIRCRHFENEESDREELIAISHDLTQQVNEGKLLVGITLSDAKPITKTHANA